MHMNLFGRDEDVAALRASQAAVTVVTGDSGAGKTSVLTAAAVDGEPGSGHSSLVLLQRRPGALQIALIDSLQRTLLSHAENEGTLDRVGRLLTDALARVAEDRLQGLAKSASALIFGFIKDKAGDTIGQAMEDVADQLRSSAEDQLSNRLTAAADHDVVAAFIALAAEIQKQIGTPLVLSLDNAERLGEDDMRILLDVVETLPEGVRIRLGLAGTDDSTTERITQLRAAGAAVVPLDGLSQTAVREWAEAVGQQVDLDLLMRVTHGLPVYVDAALAHLAAGGELRELPIAESFAAQTQQAFNRLDKDVQDACRILSALPEPAPDEEILELLNCDSSSWLYLQRRLAQVRFFSTVVGQRPWFHEVRRRALWEQTLNDAERSDAARRVITQVRGAIDRGWIAPRHTIALARLCPLDSAFLAEHEKVEAVLALNLQQLRLLTSLLELETPESPVLETGAVLSHARETLGSFGDLASVLRSLADTGLVMLQEQGDASVSAAVWGSNAARLVCIGRAAEVLARQPVPRLATRFFDSVLGPALGVFHQGQYGVGQPSATRLGKLLTEGQVTRSDQFISIEPQRPGLTTRLSADQVALYGCFTFNTSSDRDQAFLTINALPNEQPSIEVVHLAKWPHPDPLPATRFEDAWNLVTGNSPSEYEESPPAAEILQRSVRLRNAIRDLSDPITRAALQMEEPTGYVFTQRNDRVLHAEVVGLDGVIELPHPPSSSPQAAFDGFSPYLAVELAQAAGLTPAQHVGTFHWSGPIREDHTERAVQDTAKAMNAFNDAQGLATERPRLEVLATEAAISALIKQSLDRLSADAMAFVGAGGVAPHLHFKPYQAIRAIVRIPPADPRLVYGAGGIVTYIQQPAANENSVHVVVETGSKDLPQYSDPVDQIKVAFGLSKLDLEHGAWVTADLLHGLMRLTGMPTNSASLRLVATED